MTTIQVDHRNPRALFLRRLHKPRCWENFSLGADYHHQIQLPFPVDPSVEFVELRLRKRFTEPYDTGPEEGAAL